MLSSIILAFLLPATHATLTHKGVDCSSLLVEEAAGHSYIGIDGNTKPLEKILHNNGVNTVRQRLWYGTSDDDYNVDYNIELAKRAQAVGVEVYLDIFFSETWTDPGHQTTPSAWVCLQQWVAEVSLHDRLTRYAGRLQRRRSSDRSAELHPVGHELVQLGRYPAVHCRHWQ